MPYFYSVGNRPWARGTLWTVCCSLVAVKQREPEDDESDTFALTVVCDFLRKWRPTRFELGANWIWNYMQLTKKALCLQWFMTLEVNNQRRHIFTIYKDRILNLISTAPVSVILYHTYWQHPFAWCLGKKNFWWLRDFRGFQFPHTKLVPKKSPVCGHGIMRAYGHILDSQSSTSNARCCRVSSAFTSATMCNSGPRFGWNGV